MSATTFPTRREFLKTSATGGAGLVLGFYLPGKYEALAGTTPKPGATMNAWVQIAPDDSVLLIIDKSEMGQGISTALTTNWTWTGKK
jgi:isoquinoline 1-oxidoreductase beta subunit